MTPTKGTRRQSLPSALSLSILPFSKTIREIYILNTVKRLSISITDSRAATMTMDHDDDDNDNNNNNNSIEEKTKNLHANGRSTLLS